MPYFSDDPASRATRFRLTALLLLSLAWLYSKSVFAPWAESAEPRLWLYDTLLYSGFALYAWGLLEALRLGIIVRRRPERRRALVVPLLLLACAALVGLSHQLLHRSGTGWDLRVAWSGDALQSFQTPAYSDDRQRVGWLLVDTVRTPCEIEPWLWLGRPFGAGSGINRALVFSPGSVPLTPHPSGIAFMAVNERWWMAYQNPERYYGEPGLAADACQPGQELDSHRQGERFIRR